MKKLLAFIFLAAALALAADNYQMSFNAWLSDGKLDVADSVLTEWSRATPDDPELFPARYNLLLYRANNQGHWQDSLVDQAFAEIDRGIVACPDRVDFRIAKTEAASMTSRWTDLIEAVDGLLDRDAANDSKWRGRENAPQAKADSLVAEAVSERLSEIYASQLRDVVESALPLAAKAAKHFSGDKRFLNIAGTMNFGVGHDDAAIGYFEEAVRVAPDEGAPLINLGYIHYQMGDTAKALEIYHKVEAGSYDEKSHEYARQMIAKITTPLEDMKEYYYFFRYLPQVASQVTLLDNFLDIKTINTSIPTLNQLRSPFADIDIKAEKVPQEEGGTEVVVWTFPMPTEIPLCRYMAFVPDGKGGCKVFTLEKSLENYWIVGTMHEDAHTNFGSMPYPDDAPAFVRGLREKGLLE